MILKKSQQVGIVSYGSKIPRFTITGEEIAKRQGKSTQKIYKSLGVDSKTLPGVDEDTITLSTASAFQAITRLEDLLTKNSKKIGENLSLEQKKLVREKINALYIGSESHPYAVKPSGTVVAQALGISSDSNCDNLNFGKPLATADLQFACKAGTQALQIASLYVLAGFSELALAIGTDTAQSRPGDVLEYTAGAGSAAFLLGCNRSGSHNSGSKSSEPKVLAKILAMTSIATDTPDFWRRQHQEYPEHAGRFTGDPGYFYHIEMAIKQILTETGLKPKDFDYCVFHTPNAKFPQTIAKKLGFTMEQLTPSLLVTQIGNTYAAASPLGLISTLDIAKKNKKILLVSYGSGAGSDAFVFETTEYLEKVKKIWKK